MDMDAPGIARDQDVTALELDGVREGGPALWLGGGVIATALFIAYPPTHAIGWAGWLVVALVSAASVSIPVWQRLHPEAYTQNILYVQAWISLVLIVVAQWLSGPGAPWHEMLILSLVAAAFVQ